MGDASLAFIGGSGLYVMDALSQPREVHVETPFGVPSDAIVLGNLGETRVAFLPRHGRGHRLLPGEIPARANIYALKSLGVERVVSISAVGSLKEDVRPLDLIVPDQLIDRTRGRVSTFFGDGLAVHVGFAEPFCPELSSLLVKAARRQGVTTHRGGTYVVMEGPQFSTRAESELYRSWGASVIGMTALPEAKLAREAEMCYATLALVTDYDCWNESEASVSAELVVANLQKNVATSQRVLGAVVSTLGADRGCGCGSALQDAIITSPGLIPRDTRRRLSVLIGDRIEQTAEVK